MKKLLVPTDFSRYADDALHLAILFAIKMKSEIVLLNVLEYSDYVSGAYSMSMVQDYLVNNYSKLKKQSEQRLEERKTIVTEQGVSCTTKICVGLL